MHESVKLEEMHTYVRCIENHFLNVLFPVFESFKEKCISDLCYSLQMGKITNKLHLKKMGE